MVPIFLLHCTLFCLWDRSTKIIVVKIQITISVESFFFSLYILSFSFGDEVALFITTFKCELDVSHVL